MAYIKAQPFKPQFEDVNGNPLYLGSIEFYIWNTSTPTPYYTDSAGTVGGTSLTLSLLGKSPTDIFWDTAIVYKIVVKDSSGSTIDTLGPFSPVLSITTDLSDTLPVTVDGTTTPILLKILLGHFVTPEMFGGVADGDSAKTDNAAALQNALDSGKLVFLDSNKYYAFGSQLSIPSYGGFIGLGARGNLVMLTGSGKFDVSDYGHSYASNSCGILAYQVTQPIIQCNVQMESNAAIRTCNAIALRKCTDAILDVDCSGFKEAEVPIIAIDSAIRGQFKAVVHDCTSNTTTLPSMQITGMGIDGNRIGGLNSQGYTFDCIFKSIRLGSAAYAAYGEQTDGMNIATIGYGGCSGKIYGSNVGEVLDCFADSVIADVVAESALNYGVKLVHGASNCSIRASIHNAGIAGCVIGSADPDKSCTGNKLDINYYSDTYITGGPSSPCPAFILDGGSAVNQPRNNTINLLAHGDGVHMSYAIDIASGYDNVIHDLGSTGWATALSQIQSSYRSQGNRILTKRGTNVQAYPSAGVGYTTGSIVKFNTELVDVLGEYDPTTGVTTLKTAGEIYVKGQLRVGVLPAGKTITVRVRLSTVEKIEFSYTNTSAGNVVAFVPFNIALSAQYGDTVDIYFAHDAGGSLTIDGAGTPMLTYLNITHE